MFAANFVQARPMSPGGANADAQISGARASAVTTEAKTWVEEKRNWAEGKWKQFVKAKDMPPLERIKQAFWGTPAAPVAASVARPAVATSAKVAVVRPSAVASAPAAAIALPASAAPSAVPVAAAKPSAVAVPAQAMLSNSVPVKASTASVANSNLAIPAPVAAAVPIAAAVAIPIAIPIPVVKKVEEVGGRRSNSGVAIYDIKVQDSIPRLDIEREAKIKASRYYVEGKNLKVLEDRILHPFETPEVFPEKAFRELVTIPAYKPIDWLKMKDVEYQPKGKLSRGPVDRVVMVYKPEAPLALKAYVPLTTEETRLLTGLLMYQQGDKCASAVGLFHALARNPEYQSEADYYLAMCSRSLGLESDFIERARRVLDGNDLAISRKMLKELRPEVSTELVEILGTSLNKAVANKKVLEGLDANGMGTVAYILSLYASQIENYKLALTWAKQVPETHAKYLEAQFLLALAEYQTGNKEGALKIQEKLVASIKTDKTKDEFQALIALNAARMFFQEHKFKPAQASFIKVAKDHPLWLQSLTEMGWSQLMSGDYEGAIGNMYSIQSPFFGNVFKPESYVIRTIGYLNLCQFGDAYRILGILEHDYRPQEAAMGRFLEQAKTKPGAHYQAVKSLLASRESKEVDGLPAPVVREMARHKDFITLQKALNREVDEKQVYGRLDSDIDKSLKQAQVAGETTLKRINEIKKNMAMHGVRADLEANRTQRLAQLETETNNQETYAYMVELFADAKKALPTYRNDMGVAADARMGKLKVKIEKTLNTRLARLRNELGRILENNELLRYEVFAGSGENIRFQVAGGEKGNRVPASVIPKAKSLQWVFDGEYWEDEVGHYRSSLKNNCPDSAHHDPAQSEGGNQ
jgi:tetratricopeptide (TPR) repeat protein